MIPSTITVITPVLNGGKFILDCLESVRRQSHEAKHIIVDGGSTDDTIRKVRDFGGIVLLEFPGSNIYEALNAGIMKSDTDLVAFLNCDDFYPHDEVLGDVVRAFEASQHTSIVYGDCRFVNSNGDPIYTQRAPKKLTYLRAKRCLYIVSHPSCFFRRSLFLKLGLYDTKIALAADCEFVIRVLKRQEQTCYIPAVLSVFRLHGENASRLNSAKNDWVQISLKYNFEYSLVAHYFFLLFYNLSNFGYLIYRLRRAMGWTDSVR